ncbi:MAG: hypothetical protein HY426_02620 [Candidatus Levybacteria bacterium]|nr:hypothetical protein [Candidatus Levybacteria bacterium]
MVAEMAERNRELTYAEKELRRKKINEVPSDLSSEEKDQVLSRFSRRTFLVRSGQVGAAAVGAAAVAGLAGGFGIGTQTGAQDERGRNYPKGVLTPELRERFKNDGIFVYEPEEDETVASTRAYMDSLAAGFDIPPSLFAIPEGKTDPDTVAAQLKWLAIDPANPSLGTGDEGVKGLQSLVTQETTNVQTLLGRKDIQIVSSSLRPIHIIGLELAYRKAKGQSLFSQVSQEGSYMIIPGAKVGNEGAALGISESGVSWNVYDASTSNPTPPPYPLFAARVIGAK